MLSVHGGIAFKNNERTNSLPIQNITSPDYIFLNIPDGFVLNVTEGEQVDIGQAVAFSTDETASPVYSGISGNVCCISENTVTIKNDFKNHIHPGLSPIEIPLKEISDKELEALIKLMGIYDDQTPLYKKIKEAFGKIENIIISCTDTEPPAGASHAIVKEFPRELLGGIKILIHATKARRGIITLSVNNTKTDELLKEMISDPKLITTRIIENKYPLENDKYLIYALTRKEYQQNDLVKDSKCLVLKPESVVALYKCFTTGIPFVNKIISVSGKISEQKNLSVPI
jgi:electron transport complex protein RnfC